MDLGCHYTEEEKRRNADYVKKLKRHLLEMKEVHDIKYRVSVPPPQSPTPTPLEKAEKEEKAVIVQIPILVPPVILKATPKVYKIERIFKDHCKIVFRKKKTHKKYFVKWTGYTSCTWQYKSVLIKDLGYSVFNKLLF